MPATTKNINIENFYNTLITSDIAASGDVSFTVAVAPAGTSNTKGFVIVEPSDDAKRERMFYTRSGSTLTVKGINRFNPNAHLTGATIKMNDTAEIFNFLQANISTTFYIEPIGGLDVNVWGGPVLVSQSSVSVADTTINLAYPLNYIYYDTATNTIGNTNIEGNATGPIVAEVSASGGFYTGTVYRNHKFGVFGGVDDVTLQVDPTTKEMEIKSVPGSLITMTLDELSNVVVATPTIGQTVIWDGVNWINSTPASGSGDGTNLIPAGATVSWNGSTELTVTLSSGVYTAYNLTGIYTYDVNNNQLSAQLLTGVYDSLIQSLVYDGTGMSVSVITGAITSSTSGFAYLASPNTFTGVNTFEGDVSFMGRTSFPYKNKGNVTGAIVFDQKDGMQQKITLVGNTTLGFTNMVQSAGILAVVADGTSSLTFANPTNNGAIVNTGIIAASFTNGGVLASGAHFFSIAVFDTAVHVTYIGKSVFI